ncbi:MAG: hypothetical protein C5B60_03545 [Chloroflexi bacterium]|nr:MAG: hypothetical protein C5B60_03545 [Chloroflexota bacterium]
MGIITHYVLWIGHDAGGTLPRLDVVAGILESDARRVPAWWSPLCHSESLVLVPAQWIGDWETGHTLAPAYQYLWRVQNRDLHSLPCSPRGTPYRPDRLPEAATGPRSYRGERNRVDQRTTGNSTARPPDEGRYSQGNS